MSRQRVRNAKYRELLDQSDATDDYDHHKNIQLQRQRRIRQENVLEAQIQPNDTLQAIALRYNCTISDLKRLNKIEKDFEIHARKTIKVPVNAHTILLSTNLDELPIVHKSGQNSPHHLADAISSRDTHIADSSHQLPNSILDEKLLVASVSLAGNSSSSNSTTQTNHRTILSNKTDITAGETDLEFSYTDPLMSETNELYDEDHINQTGPHAIRGAPRSDFTCSGSDCDISWICLLVFILALCFAIPLIYIIYIAEHPDQFHHKEAEQFVIG